MTLLLKAPSRYQEEIRKSRFLAQAVPLSRPAEVEGLLRQLSAPDATHNCWAWRFGQQYRFSDDGEPAGTAGRPILAAIEHKGFDQVQVVVTRWYGGILLGTGGLVRGHCPYSQLETFKSRLPDLEAVLEDEQFDAAGARLTLALPSARLPAAQVLLRSLSRGESELVVLQD